MTAGPMPPGLPPLGAAPVRRCPFCEAEALGAQCPACGRNTTAPRRPCATCGRMTPTADAACWNCGTVLKSELRWKVPVIILLFILASILGVVIRAL